MFRYILAALLTSGLLPAQMQVMRYEGVTSMGMRADAQPVKGAPYSAVATTEFTQTLADGNRIVNKTTSSVARDSQGRTRRDQTIAAIGPWTVAGGKAPQLVFIQDPVAQTSYVLEPDNKIARKTPVFNTRMARPAGAAVAGSVSGGQQITIRSGAFGAALPPPPPGAGDVVFMRKEVHVAGGAGEDEQVSKESLGTQTFDGIVAEGTRTKRTIPAGAMGNERPIEIVSESWYSLDLQVVVYSKRNDPRVGEDTYRLTNIQREEPPASLFTIPADYKVVDTPEGKMQGLPPLIHFEQKLLP